jgi:hypothetical protein
LNASGKISEHVVGFVDRIVYYLLRNSEFGKIQIWPNGFKIMIFMRRNRMKYMLGFFFIKGENFYYAGHVVDGKPAKELKISAVYLCLVCEIKQSINPVLCFICFRNTVCIQEDQALLSTITAINRHHNL